MAEQTGSRVLIAAADSSLRQQIYKRLLDQNVFSDTVADGFHALQQLATVPYSVVLLDVDLPAASAERIVEAIGILPLHRRPVVLVLATGSAARTLDVDVVQVVLRKPVNLSDVTEIVASCIRVAFESQPASETMVSPRSPSQEPAA